MVRRVDQDGSMDMSFTATTIEIATALGARVMEGSAGIGEVGVGGSMHELSMKMISGE